MTPSALAGKLLVMKRRTTLTLKIPKITYMTLDLLARAISPLKGLKRRMWRSSRPLQARNQLPSQLLSWPC